MAGSTRLNEREAGGSPSDRTLTSTDGVGQLRSGTACSFHNVFADTYPDAELILMRVEEPLALVHAPNESVDPGEIERFATAEALFLQSYAR